MISNQKMIDILAGMADAVRVAEKKWPRSAPLPNGTGSAGRLTWETMARNACDRAARDGRLAHCHIFDEETAEVMAAEDPKALRAELFDVISVCVRWIADIDETEQQETAT